MPSTPSVQLYSVREAIAADLPAALERIAGLGFRQVEPYGFVDRADEYVAALASAGLDAPSAHAPVLQYEDPSVAFDAAARLGVSTLIDPHHPVANWATHDQVLANADRMNALGEAAKGFGLTFGYHNHWFEIESRIDGATALELLAEHLSDDVVLEVDTYWAEVGGVSAIDLLHRLGGRVRLIHVKDGPVSMDKDAQQPAGSGAMDVPGVLAAAPDATRVLEFDAYAGDVFDGLAQSLAYVRRVEA